MSITSESPWLRALRPWVSVLRHGHSRALEKDLVVSGMEHGCKPEFGLTEYGRCRVAENVRRAIQEGRLQGDELVVSSPFSRTRETARILCDLLDIPTFDVDPRLRERFFGVYDMGPAGACYQPVWALDREDPAQTHNDVESLVAVQQRLSDYFQAWFSAHRDREANRKLIVVTHGDPALLAESLFRGEDPRDYREDRDLAPGELRDLSGPSAN